jgi:hypothetical protein
MLFKGYPGFPLNNIGGEKLDYIPQMLVKGNLQTRGISSPAMKQWPGVMGRARALPYRKAIKHDIDRGRIIF